MVVSVENIVEFIKKLGANNVCKISASEVVYQPEFRQFCVQNSCGKYGKNHSCPPFCGDEHELIAKAKTYDTAIVYQTISDLEDSYDFEGMMDAASQHFKIAHQVSKYCYENFKGKYLNLSNGNCQICEKCSAMDNLPCRFPNEIIPSMDSYCVYVSELAKSAGMNYVNGQDTVTYFSMLLIKGVIDG